VFKNYYLILDVNKEVSSEEIKRAYKNQARRWHPDLNPGIDTTQNMQDVNEAYLILSDTETRNRYDIEYERFINIEFDNARKKEFDYEISDEILEKWINNARKQALDLVNKTIKEVAELSITATNTAGTKMFELVIAYGIAALIVMFLFRACL
jgi:DnaJ-class molecular chaperone